MVPIPSPQKSLSQDISRSLGSCNSKRSIYQVLKKSDLLWSQKWLFFFSGLKWPLVVILSIASFCFCLLLQCLHCLLCMPLWHLLCVLQGHLLPGTLVGPRSLQKLPFQHLLELDHIQMPQGLCPFRVLHGERSWLDVTQDVSIVLILSCTTRNIVCCRSIWAVGHSPQAVAQSKITIQPQLRQGCDLYEVC